FKENVPDLVRALAPAERGLFKRIIAALTDGRYREAKRTMAKHAIGAKQGAAEMAQASLAASRLLREWRASTFSAATPITVDGGEELLRELGGFEQTLAGLSSKLSGPSPPAKSSIADGRLEGMPLDALAVKLVALRDDAETARRIPALR